jgi:hypothetical protein
MINIFNQNLRIVKRTKREVRLKILEKAVLFEDIISISSSNSLMNTFLQV